MLFTFVSMQDLLLNKPMRTIWNSSVRTNYKKGELKHNFAFRADDIIKRKLSKMCEKYELDTGTVIRGIIYAFEEPNDTGMKSLFEIPLEENSNSKALEKKLDELISKENNGSKSLEKKIEDLISVVKSFESRHHLVKNLIITRLAKVIIPFEEIEAFLEWYPRDLRPQARGLNKPDAMSLKEVITNPKKSDITFTELIEYLISGDYQKYKYNVHYTILMKHKTDRYKILYYSSPIDPTTLTTYEERATLLALLLYEKHSNSFSNDEAYKEEVECKFPNISMTHIRSLQANYLRSEYTKHADYSGIYKQLS